MKDEQTIRQMKEELEKFLKNETPNCLLNIYISKKTKQGLPVMIRTLNWVLEEKNENT
jgi:hypothetical protein